ncbi:hypothetical protein [Shinella sp.]|uniref:hypothetical protein n=1 Tax=Shinella sp. TaxID=1870904 RepID=UPI003F6E8BC9
MNKLLIAPLALLSMASAAMATAPLPEGGSKLNAIVQGHGQPGDIAVSTSNPEVSFRVLDNGLVERTNSRFGTVSYVNPEHEAQFRNAR